MSHGRERKEKNCLNCGSTVQGRFCQVCGQENVEPQESLWALISHFFNDFTHFDGKFFQSIKNLFFRPGFLPEEYMKGRRASHLNPIRMYIFTSAFFFLLFFSFFYPDKDSGSAISINTINDKALSEINAMDSVEFAKFTKAISLSEGRGAVPMTRSEFESYKDTLLNSGFRFTSSRYNSREEYDSLLKAGVKKHNWLERQFIYKEIDLNKKYNNSSAEISAALKSKFLHNIPQLLFISLPLVALVLKLIYIRRKQYFFVNHAIFSIYLYIFLFMSILTLFALGKLKSNFNLGILNVFSVIIAVGIFVYEYAALKYFYKQGRVKTILKFILFNILFFLILSFLFLFFVFFSLYNL